MLRAAVPVGVTRVGRALETVKPGEEEEEEERYDDMDIEEDFSCVLQGSLEAEECVSPVDVLSTEAVETVLLL